MNRQQLLQRVLSAQEDERRRIARDLHDEIGQALTSVLVGLGAVAAASTLTGAREQAKRLRPVVVAAMEEVQRLARGLRPSVLDDLGLASALERYAEEYSQTHDIAVKVHTADWGAARLPEVVETTLYRIAQEALANTARHAGARNVRIRVRREGAYIQLTIADDGRGFNCHNKVVGIGMAGMRERAALLDGSVTIRSQVGRGATVTVRIPLTISGEQENHGQDRQENTCVACG